MSQSPFSAKPIRVIHVKGDDSDIGREHAQQLLQDIPEGMTKFYFDLWSRFTKEKAGNSVRKYSKRAILAAIDRLVTKNLHGQIPDWMHDRIHAMASVTNVPPSQLFLSLVLPDLFPILQALFMKFRPQMAMQFQAPTFGCSSFVKEGKSLLHGRNLDFPGVGYWDRFPVIQVTNRKNSLKYIGFTSAGVPLCGITGVNESQISVSLHQHYSLDFSVKGKLPFVVGEQILSKAKSLNDALTILESSRIASAWAFIVTDGKSKNAFIYESHSGERGVRFLKNNPGPLTHSNFFQCSECKPSEYSTTARMNWDNYWRNERLATLVRQEDDITPALGTQYISDHVDGYWKEEKVTNRIVSQVFNIKSLLLDVTQMKVWMAEGNSPIHTKHYREFDLGKLFAGKTESEEATLPSYHFQNESIKRAKEKYIEGFYFAFEEKFDLALHRVKEALQIHPFAEGMQVAGLLALKTGKFQDGEALFEKAVATIDRKLNEKQIAQPPPEYFEAKLFLARAKDLLGKRGEAVNLYKKLANDSKLQDRSVKYLATQAKKFKEKDTAKIIAPFSGYIPFL